MTDLFNEPQEMAVAYQILPGLHQDLPILCQCPDGPLMLSVTNKHAQPYRGTVVLQGRRFPDGDSFLGTRLFLQCSTIFGPGVHPPHEFAKRNIRGAQSGEFCHQFRRPLQILAPQVHLMGSASCSISNCRGRSASMRHDLVGTASGTHA